MIIIKKSALYTLLLLFYTVTANAQFVVDGSNLTIQDGARIYIDTDFINQSSGLTDNQGTITVTGDWLNNGTTNPITMNQGLVELVGDNQLIGGTNSTTFNHLVIASSGMASIDRLTRTGSMGTLQLNRGVLFLNGNTFEVQNPSDTAISSIMGAIASETSPTEGTIRWDIRENIGTYIFPMGTTSGNHIPVEIDVTTNGLSMPNRGSISVSTYPTNDSNRLLPSGISNMNLNGIDVSLNTVDRFWNIETIGYMTEPISNINFTYERQNGFKPNNSIIEDSLLVLSWNPNWTQNQSTVNTTDSAVTLNDVSTYRNYTLYSRNRTITSIEEFNDKLTLEQSIFPNPSNGEGQVVINSKLNTLVTVQFYNNTGQLIKELTEPIQIGINRIKFDLYALPNGIYQVVFSAANYKDNLKLILTK